MPTLSANLKDQSVRIVHRLFDWPTHFLVAAANKWEAGGMPAPCIEELKGKEPGLVTGCDCDGCREHRFFTYLFLVQALAKRDGLR